PAPSRRHTLSLHDALPIYRGRARDWGGGRGEHQREREREDEPNESHGPAIPSELGPSYPDPPRHESAHSGALVANCWREHSQGRSEEHTSELQSLAYLVCR